MEFRININKSHVILIIVLLIITGFGIAQTPSNPGHPASQIDAGTFNGQFSFNDKVTINDNDADFMTVTNTNTGQNHIALISNKEDFGVWSTSSSIGPNGGWADFNTRNLNAAEITSGYLETGSLIATGDVKAEQNLYLGTPYGRVYLYVAHQSSGTCNNGCTQNQGICLGSWKPNPTLAGLLIRTTCTDSLSSRCLCAGYYNL